MSSTKRDVSDFAKSCGLGLSRNESIVWLKHYLKDKPWASWARRQLAETKEEIKQGEETN